MKRILTNATLALGLVFAAGAFGATAGVPATGDSAILAKAAHEIRMYSRYTIFDDVQLAVHEGNLEISGAVSQPFKKADMERLMKGVPGVASVTNRLDVLPLSSFDNDLRLRIARAVYSDPALSRYGIGAQPPIHIIVKNGEVRLEGVVNSNLEKVVAGQRANTAGLSFGPVVNNLQVEKAAKRG
jgi:hyperosmotically inducible periplasmic protein